MTAGRVYPRDTDSPLVSGEHPKIPADQCSRNSDSPPVSGGLHRPMMSQDSLMSKESFPHYEHSWGPPSGTYIVQVPKDQIYRVPPPENAHKYQRYTYRKQRRNHCRCCLCTALGLLLFSTAIAVAGCIFYLIYQPKSPAYSVDSISIRGINLTSSAATISPAFNVTLRAENPNGKLGIYYEEGSSVSIYHNDVEFSHGALPAFYQSPENVTMVSTELIQPAIVLSRSARESLLTEQQSGKVPLNMNVEMPAKIQIGAVTTWTVNVKLSCAVTVNGLTTTAKVVSKACDFNFKLW
ncbi:hypothetical protein Nepgr_008971 [Nepenthes gracilis]|uniref:Late embryogenesis abundant protein LEA-2 subgroup domain-containing protein n=1 Tax=Nepenthes gracilis TaxID=150966 RepID=A0AAD3SAK0_NEPGR|nr:hypothetical protein Nepgr_008971 [Nepenthes gracilis]